MRKVLKFTLKYYEIAQFAISSKLNVCALIWYSMVCGTISAHDIECPLFTSYITRWPFSIMVGATSVDRFCIPSYMCACIGVSTSMVVKRGKRGQLLLSVQRDSLHTGLPCIALPIYLFTAIAYSGCPLIIMALSFYGERET